MKSRGQEEAVMGRIVKVVGLVAGALLVLLVAVMIGVSVLFDPNDYKDRITAAVDDATGRTLTLEGDLSLNLFPRLSIGLGAAEFSNAEGFGDAPFARFESAELRVGILPLLSRRLEIDRASLSGLRLNLARDAQGRTNWDDLSGGASADADADDPAADEGQSAGGAGDLDISVGAVEIVDAEVTWQDASADQDWTLSNFNFAARGFDPGRAFPLEIGFDLAGNEVSVSVETEMRASIALADNQYRLEDLTVDLEGEGEGWPGGSGEVHLEFDSFAADLGAQRLELEGLVLEMLGLSVSGNLVGENFMDNLSLAGGIEIDEFEPREIMSVFDADIETADPDVLGRASARAEFYYDASSMGMRDMSLALDDSTLTGAAGLDGERFEFDLVVDSIDIDRYLPPAAEGEASEDTGSVDEIDLPIDRLENFSAGGSLALNEARFLGMAFSDANFTLAAGNGRMTLTPSGALYGGTLDGEIGIAVQGDAARFTLRSDLANVDMAGVGRDYLKTEALAGTGSVRLNLASSGTKVGEIKRGLDGTAAIEIADGALLGVDIWHRIMSVRAAVTGPEVEPLDGPAQTPFERIAISGPVEDAVMTTEEFSAILPFASLSGEGTIDLLTTELELSVRAGLVDGPTLQQDPIIAEYAGSQIPLTITGTLDAPLVLPDVGALMSQAVQRAVEEEVDEAVDEAREDLQDRARERLRGLFDR
jgi:AsmA protein